MTCLSLFSGIGCHDYGLRMAGIDIVGQVEIEPMPMAVLEKHFPESTKWRDVREVTTKSVSGRCGRIDLITGGFPCTDISVAGKGAGIKKGTRSGLWREMFRLIRGLRPRWIIIENVPALRTRGADRVFDALERIGYSCRPVVVGAEHCGAPHRRHRVWIVGKLAECERIAGDGGVEIGKTEKRVAVDGAGDGELAHAEPAGGRDISWPARPGQQQYDWEEPRLVKFEVGATDAGDARELVRLARRHNKETLRAAGNANPWIVPYLIGRWIVNQEMK